MLQPLVTELSLLVIPLLSIGFVVILGPLRMPFNCLGPLDTCTIGCGEESDGIEMILGPPFLCIGHLRLVRVLLLEVKGPSTLTRASRSASTAEAMESGRIVLVLLQVFL